MQTYASEKLGTPRKEIHRGEQSLVRELTLEEMLLISGGARGGGGGVGGGGGGLS